MGSGLNNQKVKFTWTVNFRVTASSLQQIPQSYKGWRWENSEEVREKRPMERVINRGYEGQAPFLGTPSEMEVRVLCWGEGGCWLSLIIAFRVFQQFYGLFEISPSI